MYIGMFASSWNSNTNIRGSFCLNSAKSTTLQLDASFFCPAAISFMPEGWHLSISSNTDINSSATKYIDVKEELYAYLWMIGIGIDYNFKNK